MGTRAPFPLGRETDRQQGLEAQKTVGNQAVLRSLREQQAVRDATAVAGLTEAEIAAFQPRSSPTREAVPFTPDHAFYELLAHELAYRNDLDGRYLYRAGQSFQSTEADFATLAPTDSLALPEGFAIMPVEPEIVPPNFPIVYQVHTLPDSDPDNQSHGLGAYFLVPIHRPDAPGILVFRGTEGAMADILADAEKEGPGAASFKALLNRIRFTLGEIGPASGKIVVTGHSLGGAIAQLTCAALPWYVDECVTFNSPGISRKALAQFSNGTADFPGAPQVSHYVTRGDIVSTVGQARLPGTVTMLDSDATCRLEWLYLEETALGLVSQALSDLTGVLHGIASDQGLSLTAGELIAMAARWKLNGTFDAFGELAVFGELHSARLLPGSVAVGNPGNVPPLTTTWKTEPPAEELSLPLVEGSRVLVGEALRKGLDALNRIVLPVLRASLDSMVLTSSLLSVVAKDALPLLDTLVAAIAQAGGLRKLVGLLLYIHPTTGQIHYWLPPLTIHAGHPK
ncbi:MAG: lipase family [Acidobacteria bacterium]|nr:lipase family [Acidobacteriota bacterium]